MDSNMTPAALHLLKVSTFGTALYGFYMAYALHQKKEIQKKYIALPTFPQTDFERAYLTFLMSGNGEILFIRNMIASTLKDKYGVVVHRQLKNCQVSNENKHWRKFRALMERVWAMLDETSMNKHTFCSSFFAVFSERPALAPPASAARAKMRTSDFQDYMTRCMCLTLDSAIETAAINAKRELTSKKDSLPRTDVDISRVIWQQCVDSGSLNDESVITTSEQTPQAEFHVYKIIQAAIAQ
jgi:hypothetical protein